MVGVAVVGDDPLPERVATLVLVDEVGNAEDEARDVDTSDIVEEVASTELLVAVLTSVPDVLAPAFEARVPLSPSDEESASS